MKKSLCLLFIALPLYSATYYIDYENGLDSNAGTSKTAPWKHCPGMNGFSGTYTHTAGDRFIFKGGTIWPSAAFPLTITRGGAQDNNDYYGVDSTWHAGTAWTRPVFDLEDTAVKAPVNMSRVNYLRIDNLEIINHKIAAGQEWGNGGIQANNCTYLTISNCFIHDWSVEAGANDDRLGGIVCWQCGPGIVIEGCHVYAGLPGNSGVGISANGVISHCTVHDVSNGIMGGGTIHDSHIYDIRASFDPVQHENGVYIFGSCSFYNNIVHNVEEGTTVYPNAGWGGRSGTVFIYNNLIYDNGPTPINIDAEQTADTAVVTYHIYNNLLKSYNSDIRVTPRSAASLDTLYIKNNILITTGTWVHSASIEHPVDHLAMDNNLYYNQGGDQDFWVGTVPGSGNLTFEQSIINGYNQHSVKTAIPLDYDYRPTTGASLGVDAGTDLSFLFTFDLEGTTRPVGAGWDIGPYEYKANGIFKVQYPLPNTQYPLSNEKLQQLFYDLTGKKITGKRTGSGIYMMSAGNELRKVFIIK